jgi:ArsR family transcriptional regulator, arsenate/arsenite/antimonite-responsive transcriptional repressor
MFASYNIYNMTFSKVEEFDKDLQELARIAKVLSHPARLAILRYLANQKKCISGDISNHLPLSRTTISQHLQELKKSGLIKGSIDGLFVCYCIDFKNLNKVFSIFNVFFDDFSPKSNCKC